MRRYVQVSGVLFGLMGTVQFVRAVMHVPVLVADVAIPVLVSWGASLLFLALAAWAWRAAERAT